MILFQLVKRNIRLYVRDRSAVFFSFLSTIIVLVLMIAFLGEGNVNHVVEVFGDGTGEASSHARRMINLWTISGIMVVNSFGIGMMLVGTMITDEESHRLASFFVAPVKRWVYVLGYILSANIVSAFMCVMTLLAGEIYVVSAGGTLYDAGTLGKLLIAILVNVFTACAISFLLAACVHSLSAWSGLSTVVGTVIGFLSAIYLPYGSLPDFLQKILDWLPPFIAASTFREIMVEKELDWFQASAPYREGFCEYMGITVTRGEHTMSFLGKLLYVLAIGVLFIAISVIILQKRHTKDR